MKKIYILVGASGSGKSWVSNQVRDKYTYVPHDTFGLKGNQDFVRAIKAHASISEKPILCDTPYSLSELLDPLSKDGFEVKPVFILEKPSIVKARYENRHKQTGDGQPVIPKGHLSIIETYKNRAIALNAPFGTSSEILDYMRNHADKESTATQRPQPRIEHQAHNPQRNNERNEEAKAEAVQDVRQQDFYAIPRGSV